MVIAIWIVTAILLGLWSLTAWGLHGLLMLLSGAAGGAGGWSGDLRPLVDQIPLTPVLDQWLPGWQELLRATLDLAQVLIGWLGGAVPLVSWTVWGLGTAGLLLLAGGLTLVAVLLRNTMPKPARPA
ncbi:hypothetical protein ACPOLB_10980 [Rubrivivax sp. RP6-9]|uniref:hypothetical protein n=1 Tax=Rubrivivax sp. RP6-9 TaxID=3415750 RepID=UPI003CC58C00